MTRHALSPIRPLLPPLLGLLALLAALLACACAGEPASCGQIGRASACPCPGGGQGAQECGPLGVWGACVCPGADAAGGDAAADAAGADAPGEAGPDAAADRPASPDGGPDAAGDAAGADAPDAAGDAPSDSADAPSDSADAPSDSADAPSDSIASTGDAADVTGPSPIAQQLDHVEVWESVDGAPLRPVSGTCVDTGGRVVVRAPTMRVTYAYSPPGAVSSAQVRCPSGTEANDPRAFYEYRSAYGSANGIRSNLRVVAEVRAGVCDTGAPAVRVEVYAFGCPVM